ncbi:MAG: hypothetical protein MUE49_14835 [Rhodospirillales bacterium]|nr:hypothetical protein [Rhodospirillales bacterium]
MDVVYVTNDNVVELSGVANALTSAPIGTATVAVTLQTATGAAVSGLATGSTWPLTMNASAVTGTYRTTLPYTLSLTPGVTYYANITASGGATLHGEWLVPVRATTRV